MKNMKNDPKFKEIGKRQKELYGPKEGKVTELKIVKPNPKDTLGIKRKDMPQIKKQDYENFDVIFWDNNSTDDSKVIYERFSDERFKYFTAKKRYCFQLFRS